MKNQKRILATVFILLVIPSVLMLGDPPGDPANAGHSPLRIEVAEWGGIGYRTLAAIPFNAEIWLVKEDGVSAVIGGVRGRWRYVYWHGLRGWLFGAYLKDRGPVRKGRPGLPSFFRDRFRGVGNSCSMTINGNSITIENGHMRLVGVLESVVKRGNQYEIQVKGKMSWVGKPAEGSYEIEREFTLKRLSGQYIRLSAWNKANPFAGNWKLECY